MFMHLIIVSWNTCRKTGRKETGNLTIKADRLDNKKTGRKEAEDLIIIIDYLNNLFPIMNKKCLGRKGWIILLTGSTKLTM